MLRTLATQLAERRSPQDAPVPNTKQCSCGYGTSTSCTNWEGEAQQSVSALWRIDLTACCTPPIYTLYYQDERYTYSFYLCVLIARATRPASSLCANYAQASVTPPHWTTGVHSTHNHDKRGIPHTQALFFAEGVGGPGFGWSRWDEAC